MFSMSSSVSKFGLDFIRISLPFSVSKWQNVLVLINSEIQKEILSLCHICYACIFINKDNTYLIYYNLKCGKLFLPKGYIDTLKVGMLRISFHQEWNLGGKRELSFSSLPLFPPPSYTGTKNSCTYLCRVEKQVPQRGNNNLMFSPCSH